VFEFFTFFKKKLILSALQLFHPQNAQEDRYSFKRHSPIETPPEVTMHVLLQIHTANSNMPAGIALLFSTTKFCYFKSERSRTLSLITEILRLNQSRLLFKVTF
jgi:hypothetical protein